MASRSTWQQAGVFLVWKATHLLDLQDTVSAHTFEVSSLRVEQDAALNGTDTLAA